MLWILTGIVISYLVGSIPTAYIFGRLLKGIDIRAHGSGNVGATNALRLLGKRAGITVLALDIFKGFVAVALVGNYFLPHVLAITPEQLRILFGMCAIIGHNWTVFLQFKGGKGIATTLGVLLGLATTLAGLGAIIALVVATWFLVFMIARIVSLASIVAALSLPLYMILFGRSATLVGTAVILALFVCLRHKANMARLLGGKEPRLNFKKQSK